MATAKEVASITPEELMLAEADGAAVKTVEDASALLGQSQGDAGTRVGSVTHSGPGMRRAYKKTPLGWMPRMVSAANLPMLIRAGWLAACPDCGRANCGVNGDLNDCTVRPPRAYRTCNLCEPKLMPDGSVRGYRIYDDLPLGGVEMAPSSDPNEIRDGVGSASTPASRTEALWRAHILGYHPQEAPTYGVYAQIGVMAGFPQPGAPEGSR